MTDQASSKLGLLPLTALVVGGIVGSGIFSLPQNMAEGAGAGAILIAWVITFVGMLALAKVFQWLSLNRTDIGDGVYGYARAGFGDYLGFSAAWGYWISAWVGSTGYLVVIFSALGAFGALAFFGDGTTPAALAGQLAVLGLMHYLVLRGVKSAAFLNVVVTTAKMVPLVLFILCVAMAFRVDTFRVDFWGSAALGSLTDQIKNTMLYTVWVFLGIECATVYATRARSLVDVSRATMLGFTITMLLLVCVSVLSLGVVPRSELAEMRNPSMAGLMVRLMGSWGEIVIAAGLIVSVCGAYLSWTIMAAEVPFLAATHKAFPRLFARQNSNNAPSASLWLTNISVQVSLVLIWLTGSDYGTLLTIASEMILVPYLLVGAFLLKIATRPLHKAVAIGACIYGIWLLYASGPVHLLLSVVLYAPGLLVFLYARRTHQHDRSLKRREVALIGLLLVAAVPATWMLVG